MEFFSILQEMKKNLSFLMKFEDNPGNFKQVG